MSGHYSDVSCFVEIEQAKSGDIIAETEPSLVSFEDPTVIVPVLFRVTNCVFPTPGLYYVQIYHENKLIGERRLDVRLEE